MLVKDNNAFDALILGIILKSLFNFVQPDRARDESGYIKLACGEGLERTRKVDRGEGKGATHKDFLVVETVGIKGHACIAW